MRVLIQSALYPKLPAGQLDVDGMILNTDDGGTTWNVEVSHTHSYLHDVILRFRKCRLDMWARGYDSQYIRWHTGY